MNTDLPFQGKVTLVTGSGRGIGKAIAYKFAQLGSNIVLNYVRNKAQAEETCTQIKALGRKAILVAADVSKIESIDLLFQQTGREFGGLDSSATPLLVQTNLVCNNSPAVGITL
jgi:NAD(P)-dependent dehydrogenase (short-subunit alcohol dehydrogenase family)